MINENNRKNYDEYCLKREIGKFLDNMQFKHSSIGYCYWQNAILFYLKEASKTKLLAIKMETVYKHIATYFNTTRDRVEKAMRWAREQSDYKKIFSQHDYKITNKEFLTLCSERLSNVIVS